MKAPFALLLLTLCACTQVPELSERVPADIRKAGYPRLVPLDAALGQPVAPQDEAAMLQDSLQARRDALAAKARQLQAPIVDQAARDRLDDEIAEPRI